MDKKVLTLLALWFTGLAVYANPVSVSRWHTLGTRAQYPLFERHTWNALDATDEQPGYFRGSHTYTDSVFIPLSFADKSLSLSVGAANQEAWLYVNGDSVGYHAGGYTAFAFDVTPYCRFGQTNYIRLVVSNAYNENIPPLSADFTFFGGVYRDVSLVAAPSLHFSTSHYATRGVYVYTPKVSDSQASVRVEALTSGQGRVEFVVSGHGFSKTLKASARHGKATAQLTIPHPALWSPDTPNLYSVSCRLYDKHGTLCDEVSESFGLRWYAFGEDNMFYLNGQKIKLIGSSRHQCYKYLGNALPDSLQRKDILMIKAMGANFLRVAHYPQGEFIMHLCDSLGLLCSVEIPLVNAITETDSFASCCRNMLDEMVWQNRNHPSVVIWAYSNEILLRPPFKTDSARHSLYCRHTADLCRDLNARLHSLDSSRPTMIVLHDNFKEYHRYGFTQAADIVGLNIYSGWYSGTFSGLDKTVEKVRFALPHTPLLLTEFGADCDPRLRTVSPQRFDYSMDYALLFHRHYLPFVLSSPYLAGGAVWNFNDFHSEARLGALPHYNCKGLVSSDRQPKLTYFYYQSVLRSDSVGQHAADTLRQMLSMPVAPAMPLRVNLGSRCFFTDDSLCVWQPEQPYQSGSWGYIGGEPFTKKTKYGQLPAADIDILGTDSDPLYQTARVGIQSFCADFPAGRYRVILHLAELESTDREQMSVYNLGNEALSTDFSGREMVVRVHNLPADTINLTQQFGKYRAVPLCYVVDIAPNNNTSIVSSVNSPTNSLINFLSKTTPLQILFRPLSGTPILNAIEIIPID